MVDLSALPPPQMIQQIDAEAIIAQMAGTFVQWALTEHGVDVSGIIALEGEPIAVQQQFYAYQTAQLRSAFNDVLKSNLLSFASGADLDHLAADHGVVRLVGEADAALRERIVLEDQGSSSAGPEEWYEAHARRVSTDVRDVAVYRTGAGPEIAVAVLSVSNGGVPSPALLSAVLQKVSAPTIRSVNDIVSVIAATSTVVNVTADIWLLPDAPMEVFQGLEQRLRDANAEEGGIGFDVNRNWLLAKLTAPGVSKVILNTPTTDIVVSDFSAAAFGTIALSFKGRSR